MIRYEWDEKKNKLNRKKHGIWFEEVLGVFDDPLARVFFDVSHSKNEERYIIIGTTASNSIVVIVHTYKESDSIVRIISARIATKKEIKHYEKGI